MATLKLLVVLFSEVGELCQGKLSGDNGCLDVFQTGAVLKLM